MGLFATSAASRGPPAELDDRGLTLLREQPVQQHPRGVGVRRVLDEADRRHAGERRLRIDEVDGKPPAVVLVGEVAVGGRRDIELTGLEVNGNPCWCDLA